MILKQIKLSRQERDRLIRIKAKIGFKNWNSICRWALCVSLADETVPFGPDIPSDSNVEMSWGTFGGEYQEIYDAVFRERCRKDEIEDTPEAIGKYFRLHLNRGINYLASKNGPKDINALLGMIRTEE
ncbi:MAG: DNA sulfur modification protein DndE [Bacillus sp. (in: Bacteria)]|nr:DNA sulfur modification protein DndE [Bacillus sp. (in: firmicutes)]